MTQDPTQTTLGSRRTRTVSAVTATTQPDEFLRRPRMADALKSAAPSTPAGALMAQRVHARALSAAVEQLLIASLPHVDDTLTAPMVEVQLHTPGADGELIAAFQLPKQIADTVTVAIRAAASGAFAEHTEHARTADTAPAAPRAGRLSVVRGV